MNLVQHEQRLQDLEKEMAKIKNFLTPSVTPVSGKSSSLEDAIRKAKENAARA